MICNCGGDNRLTLERIPQERANRIYGINADVISRWNRCKSCGVGIQSLYEGTKLLRSWVENEEMDITP